VRTTVTIDDDIATKLRSLMHERDASFKEVLNSTLRAGLAGRSPQRRPYKLKTRPLGLRPGVDLTKALQLAAELEDEEIVRKLRQRK
jgi:hypothetical protein